MILYEYNCPDCGAVFDVMSTMDKCLEEIPCDTCSGKAKKVINFSPTNHTVYNNDAGWIKSVREVVDKDPSKPHCQKFLKDPTRENYKAWMKKEGIRPLESGERSRPELPDTSKLAKSVMKKRVRDQAVSV